MIVFAGPSLNPQSREICRSSDIDLRPPAKRGEIEQISNDYKDSKVLLVDGVFHQNLSVGHEEILDKIDQGFKVYGISSMGAIRAYELRNHGMKGWGKVYDRFVNAHDFQDDEVALLHLPGPDFKNMTEPMVHMRACIEDLILRKKINNLQADNILAALKGIYYGDRTMKKFEAIVNEVTQLKLFDLVDDFNIYREKQNDLQTFLELHGFSKHKVIV